MIVGGVVLTACGQAYDDTVLYGHERDADEMNAGPWTLDPIHRVAASGRCRREVLVVGKESADIEMQSARGNGVGRRDEQAQSVFSMDGVCDLTVTCPCRPLSDPPPITLHMMRPACSTSSPRAIRWSYHHGHPASASGAGTMPRPPPLRLQAQPLPSGRSTNTYLASHTHRSLRG